MTDDTERALRDLLTERSGEPRMDANPVTTLARRHRRRRVVRVTGTAGTTALAVLALVLGPRLVNDTPRRVAGPIGSPTTSTPGSRGPSAPTATATPRAQLTPIPGEGGTGKPLDESPDPEVRFLEHDLEFRKQTLVSDPAATVRCAVEHRGSDSGSGEVRTASFVWAMCDVVSGDVGTGVSLPVRIDYDGDRITGFLVPGDGAAYGANIKKYFPPGAARQPSSEGMARMNAEIRDRTPATKAGLCTTPEASRIVQIYLATIEALMERDLGRGIKRIYLVDRHVLGLSHESVEGVPTDQGPMPRAVRGCLAEQSVHRIPVVLVTGHDDPTIVREKPDGFSHVEQGGVVELTAVAAGNVVRIAASVSFGGGLDAHGGGFEVRRAGDRWTATSTGPTWVS